VTYEELMAQSRALAHAGNIEAAKRAADLAQKMRAQPPAPTGWVADGPGPSLTPEQADEILRNAPVGGVVYNNVVGDDDPNSQNLGEKIGSTLNKAGESMTFGVVGDETSALAESMLPGANYADRRDHYRQQERVLERDNPLLALGAEIGGALTGAAVPVLGTLGTLGRGAGVLPRMAASAGAGAGMGGTYGFMEGEGAEDRLGQARTGGIVGGVAGAAIPAIGAGVQKIADSRVANRAIREAVNAAPTSEELRAAGRAAYQAIDDAGVAVRPDAVQSRMAQIAAALDDEGADAILTPNANRVAQRFAETADGANTVPFKELDKLRRIAGNAAGANPANAADTRLSTMALEGVDDFVRNLGPEDVDAGDLETLQTMLPKARELWARMSRSQLLDDAIEAGQNNYRTGPASGMRAQFQRILNNKKLSRGFSDAEIKMMRRVVNGTIPEQIINYLGSGLGMLGQMGGAAAAGFGMGGPVGAMIGGAAGAIPAAGARRLAESVVGKNAEIARALVAAGGVPQLPVATDQARRIAESLMRRTAAAAPQ